MHIVDTTPEVIWDVIKLIAESPRVLDSRSTALPPHPAAQTQPPCSSVPWVHSNDSSLLFLLSLLNEPAPNVKLAPRNQARE